MWDVKKGVVVEEPLQKHSFGVEAVPFSLDGRLLISGSETGIIVLGVGNREIKYPLLENYSSNPLIAFSHDSSKIASSCTNF